MPLIHKLIILIAVCAPLTAYALPEDNAAKMHITADSTLFNYKTGFNTYQGNVDVQQGGTRLKADKITTQSNLHHKMEEAIAYGSDKTPADYWTVPKKGDLIFHAQANIIKFYPLKSLVMLEGNVSVTQGDNSFHGATIIYNMKNQTISAPANNQGRATIIIQPTKIPS
jgi:lipopolysaccharide export system protein LptA